MKNNCLNIFVDKSVLVSKGRPGTNPQGKFHGINNRIMNWLGFGRDLKNHPWADMRSGFVMNCILVYFTVYNK